MQEKTVPVDMIRNAVVELVRGGRRVLTIAPTTRAVITFFKEVLPIFEEAEGRLLPPFPFQVAIGVSGLLKLRVADKTRGLCNFDTLVVMPGCSCEDTIMAISCLRGEGVTDPHVIHVLENNA